MMNRVGKADFGKFSILLTLVGLLAMPTQLNLFDLVDF
jgi:hypothetical protein